MKKCTFLYFFIKRLSDVILSFPVVILLIPIWVVCALIIKFDSPGEIIYRQQRLGKNMKPFTILKFRSMYVDAEKSGPKLSCSSDNRITRFGKFLRRSHLDETPQFLNILRGDMSIVGPRPERPFFVKQIIASSPEFAVVYMITPGLTSLGQIRFGYAENISQIITRARYELFYLQKRSLSFDFKIFFLTFVSIIKDLLR